MFLYVYVSREKVSKHVQNYVAGSLDALACIGLPIAGSLHLQSTADFSMSEVPFLPRDAKQYLPGEGAPVDR